MNREQWYTSYQAARMLVQARFYCGESDVQIDSGDPARKVVWDLTYKAIKELGGEFLREAVFHVDLWVYDICDPSNRWAIKYNSKIFNRKMPIRESKKKWLDRV